MTQTDKSTNAIFKELSLSPSADQQAKVHAAVKSYYDAKGHMAKTWPVTVICESLGISQIDNGAKIAQHIL